MSYYYSSKQSISEQATASNDTNNAAAAASCCSRPSLDLKLYQAFIFSVPIFFTFILLFLFYLFYLRRRRVDWSSLRMRTVNSNPTSETTSDDVSYSRCELGVKKELREMLPIIVFNESFSVKDTLCSVCLGDYKGEERLQQIPGCGHTFHMDCIDLWLSTHTTCPLCRQSLVHVSTKDTTYLHEDAHLETNSSTASNGQEDPQTSSSETTSGERDERRIGPTVTVIGERDRNDGDDDVVVVVETDILENVK